MAVGLNGRVQHHRKRDSPTDHARKENLVTIKVKRKGASIVLKTESRTVTFVVDQHSNGLDRWLRYEGEFDDRPLSVPGNTREFAEHIGRLVLHELGV